MPDRFIDEFLFRLVDGYTDADTGEFRPIYAYRPSVIPRPHPYERDRLDAPLTTHRIEDLFHAMSMRYAFLRTAMCATEDVPAEFPMASLPTGGAMTPPDPPRSHQDLPQAGAQGIRSPVQHLVRRRCRRRGLQAQPPRSARTRRRPR